MLWCFEQSRSSHSDGSAIGWGVTDWYQSHNYRELGQLPCFALVYSFRIFTWLYLFIRLIHLHTLYLPKYSYILGKNIFIHLPFLRQFVTQIVTRMQIVYHKKRRSHQTRRETLTLVVSLNPRLFYFWNFTIKLGVKSTPWWENFAIYALVDPYRQDVNNFHLDA